MDIPANMPTAQNPQVGMNSNVHKMALRSEPSYLISGSRTTVGADATLLDTKTAAANPYCTSFGSESNLPLANDLSLINTDASSCPSQIQRNPHLWDLIYLKV